MLESSVGFATPTTRQKAGKSVKVVVVPGGLYDPLGINSLAVYFEDPPKVDFPKLRHFWSEDTAVLTAELPPQPESMATNRSEKNDLSMGTLPFVNSLKKEKFMIILLE